MENGGENQGVHSDNKPNLVASSRRIRTVTGRRKGFFTVDNLFMEGVAPLVGVHCIAVYMYLCKCADLKKQTCFPSKIKIAQKTKMGGRTVFNCIKKLEWFGIIHIERNKKIDGTNYSNFYTLLHEDCWRIPKPSSNTTGTRLHTPPAREYRSPRQQVPTKETNTKENNEISDEEKRNTLKEIREQLVERGVFSGSNK